jgi:hypothetical protein
MKKLSEEVDELYIRFMAIYPASPADSRDPKWVECVALFTEIISALEKIEKERGEK